MNNLLRAEWYKLQRNKIFTVLLVSIAGLSALLHYLIIIDWWQMNDTVFDRVGLGSLDALLTFTVPLFFNLIVSTLAGFFIATEFSNSGVIKNQIISGHHRSHVYVAKYVVFSFAAIVVTCLVPLFTGLIEVVVLGQSERIDLSHFLYLGRAYGLFIIHFLGYSAIIMLLAIVTEDSGKTIILSVLMTIAIELMRLFSSSSRFVTFIYEHTIFSQFSYVFHEGMSIDEIVQSIIVGGITIIVMISCGILLFNRKEIK